MGVEKTYIFRWTLSFELKLPSTSLLREHSALILYTNHRLSHDLILLKCFIHLLRNI